MINDVLEDSTPLSESSVMVNSDTSSNKTTDKSRLSTPPSQSDSTPGNSSQESGFSFFELNSIFSGAPSNFSRAENNNTSRESTEEPLAKEELTVGRLETSSAVGQSRVQKWTESAVLNPLLEAQTKICSDRQVAQKQYTLMQAENGMLKRKVKEAQRFRLQQAARNQTLKKQLEFQCHSLHALTVINVQLNRRFQLLKAQHNEEMIHFKLQCGQARSELKRARIRELAAVQMRLQDVMLAYPVQMETFWSPECFKTWSKGGNS